MAKVHTTVYLEPGMIRAIQEMARARRRTFGDMLRILLEDALAERAG